ncbi:hypothetical protein L798_08250, partial [Zootermopsis nevadensis]
MSRDDGTIRQHRSRLLQLAETTSANSSGKRRGFSNAQLLRSNGGRKLLQELVRSDPSYTPNIEHLVFPDRRNSAVTSPISATAPPKASSNSKATRSRLAEVFALSRYSHHSHQGGSVDSKTSKMSTKASKSSRKSLGNVMGGGHQPAGGTGRGEGPRRWASEEPVLQQSQTRTNPSPDSGKVWRSTEQQQPHRSDLSTAKPLQDATDMATTRYASVVSRSATGPNVSVLHLRSTSEPWETATTTASHGSRPSSRSSVASHVSSIPTLQVKYAGNSATQSRNSNYASLPTSRRRDTGPTALFIAGSMASSVDRGTNNGSCSRELSPVRWCDREVDGVYLGRSGWVQVQQRSLDENRRANYGMLHSAPSTAPAAPVGGTLPGRRPGIKLADYHCSNSEPGKFPEAVKVEEQQRPAFLPLPIGITQGREFEHRINSRSASPSPQDLGLSGDPMSPPSVTPIISPPPAFQDPSRRYQTAPRLRTGAGKHPFLPRSNAIVDSDIVSPPPSPPPTVNWSTLPSPRTAAPPGSLRARRLTPSPVDTHQQQPLRIPQTKSLEETTGSGTRRSRFQKNDSSSSSSSSFGFRSLDSSINPRATMPRLSETDSSVGGYEDGDEEENRESSLNLSAFSTITVTNSSPDTPAAVSGLQPKERFLVNGEKISPSSVRHRDSIRLHHQNQRLEHRTHPLRKSPGSEGNNKKQVWNNSSSSSSSSSSSCTGRTGLTHAFRRSQVQAVIRVPEAVSHSYDTWDGRNRVRRSRSLQLPETKSPGALSPGSHSHTDCEFIGIMIDTVHYQPPVYKPLFSSICLHPFFLCGFDVLGKTQSEDSRYEDGVRWEDEARAVTDYLHGTRSRAAARALLQARYHAEQEQERRSKEPEPGFNIFFVSRNKGKQQPQQRQRVLQRGITTPSATTVASVFCPNINPDTCDFWPHCAHLDSLYPPSGHSKSSTPSPSSGPKLPTAASAASNMRLSQSYPTTAVTQNQRGRNEPRRNYDNDEKSKRVDGPRGGGQSTRSSPASLERVDEYELTMPRKNQSGLNGVSSPSDRKSIPLDAEDKKPKWRNSLRQANGSPSVVSPLIDLVEDDFERQLSVPRERKASPIVNSRSPSAVGGTSSSSSSSSDVWVTTSDRTVMKSPRTQKSSGTSTPLEDASSTVMLMIKSPVGDHSKSVLEPRPGSAPAEVVENRNKVMLESQQRSLSLPKSFLS